MEMRTTIFVGVLLIIAISSAVIAGKYVKDVIDSHTFTCPEWAKECKIKVEDKQLKPGESSEVVLIAKYEPTTTTTIPIIIYDDFSGSTLNAMKWQEYTNPENGFNDEHFLDTVNDNYHVAQLSADFVHARKTRLNLTGHVFTPGEILEYDLIYHSGSGNRESTFLINGQWWAIFAPNTGAVGFWNGDFDIGNEFGAYHFKIEFFGDHITLTVTRPDNTIYSSTKSFTPPYHFEIDTTSGHDGTFHMDYDNFVIRTP